MTALLIFCLFLIAVGIAVMLLLVVVLKMYPNDYYCNDCNYNCNQGRACPYKKEKL